VLVSVFELLDSRKVGRHDSWASTSLSSSWMIIAVRQALSFLERRMSP
jgi:hypothetical protein